MNGIRQRFFFSYALEKGPVFQVTLTFLRRLRTSSSTNYSAREKDDNSESETTEKEKPSTSASNLLNTLTGIKVQKNLVSKVERSSPLRSAAADFRTLLGQKKQRVTEDGADLKRPEDVQKLVTESAKAVAEIFPEKEVVESDLLRQLRKHDEATAAGKQGDLESVSSILASIKVQRKKTPPAEKAQQDFFRGSFHVDFDMTRQTGRDDLMSGTQERRELVKRKFKTLFDRNRLNIFSPAEEGQPERQVQVTAESAMPSIWNKEEAKKLKNLTHSTIKSGFDEMIKWTEEGKTWQYPINNEQGLEDEQQVPFHEHIFFDHLLEDLPPIESIRSFMELVCIGLGQNPYLTVCQKHDHIEWFKAYFKEREGAIQEAIEAEEKARQARDVIS